MCIPCGGYGGCAGGAGGATSNSATLEVLIFSSHFFEWAMIDWSRLPDTTGCGHVTYFSQFIEHSIRHAELLEVRTYVVNDILYHRTIDRGLLKFSFTIGERRKFRKYMSPPVPLRCELHKVAHHKFIRHRRPEWSTNVAANEKTCRGC